MFRSIFLSLLYQSPFILIQTAGMVFALIQWRKHPKSSLLLVLGLGTALFHTFLFMIVLPVVANLSGLWYLTTGGSRILRILATLISAGSYGIVVFTVFFGFHEAKKLALAAPAAK